MRKNSSSQFNRVSKINDQLEFLGVGKKSKSKLELDNLTIENRLPNEWNNNLILSKVFENIQFKHLLQLSLVCRQWNQLVNPKIHQTLKLLRYRYKKNRYHGKETKHSVLKSLEIQSCIENNEKHSHLVESFHLNTLLDPKLAKHFFSTFSYLTKLTMCKLRISQDLFLVCLRPLTLLTELNLSYLSFKVLKRKRMEFEPVILPNSLTKLTVSDVYLINSRNLILETLSSHKNIRECSLTRISLTNILDPFLTNYPSLQKLAFIDCNADSFQDNIHQVFESNPQLYELHYQDRYLNLNLIEKMNRNLTNLETLIICGYHHQLPIHTVIDLSFNQFPMLKTLTLLWTQFPIPSFSSLLTNAPNIMNITVSIKGAFTPLTSLIQQKLQGLTHLTYTLNQPHRRISHSNQLSDSFISDEFRSSQYQSSNTIKSLNFTFFNIFTLKPGYLNIFTHLEMISFIHPKVIHLKPSLIELENHLRQFEGWKFKVRSQQNTWVGYLYKPHTSLTPKYS